MVEEKVESAVKLPPDMKKRLTDLQGDIAKAKRSIEVMKGLGMDVSALEEKLTWSENVSTTMLKEFT